MRNTQTDGTAGECLYGIYLSVMFRQDLSIEKSVSGRKAVRTASLHWCACSLRPLPAIAEQLSEIISSLAGHGGATTEKLHSALGVPQGDASVSSALAQVSDTVSCVPSNPWLIVR